MVLASLNKHYRCIQKCSFQSVQTTQSWCKNGFLGFHMLYYNALCKIGQIQISSNIICPRKRSWKDRAAVAVNERTQGQHCFERCLQKRCWVSPKKPRIWCPSCKDGFRLEPCFKAFILTNRIFLSSQYELSIFSVVLR